MTTTTRKLPSGGGRGGGLTLAVGDPRGDLWATSPTLPETSREQNQLIEFGTDRWDVSDEGTAFGIEAMETTEEHLVIPRVLPPAGVNGLWFVVEVDGIEVSATMLPWGILSTNRANFPLLARMFAGDDASDVAQLVSVDFRNTGILQLYGGGTTLSADTVVKVYTAVVRGEQGRPGARGLTQAQIQALIDASVRTDAQIQALIDAAGHASQTDFDALAARVAALENAGMSGDHNRYAAIRTTDGNFTAADFTGLGATSSQTDTIDTPDSADDAFLAFAVPNRLSDIRQEGGLFNWLGSTLTEEADTIDIGGTAHYVYSSIAAVAADLIGGNFTLTEA